MSKIIGYTLAILHVFIFTIFVLYINLAHDDGQLRLLWTLWLPIDFPISLFVIIGFDIFSGDSYYMSLIRIYIPYVVHGIFAPIWWFYLCRFVGYLTRNLGRASTRKSD